MHPIICHLILIESGEDDSEELVSNEHFRKQKKIKKEIFMVFASFQFIPNIFKQLTIFLSKQL